MLLRPVHTSGRTAIWDNENNYNKSIKSEGRAAIYNSVINSGDQENTR